MFKDSNSNYSLSDRPLSLILVGPSRLGKTAWARSLESKHNYFNGLFNLEEFEPGLLTILDDFNFEYFHHWKQFLGAQREFTLTDKYKKKLKVVHGAATIVLCNEGHQPQRCKSFNIEDIEWINANCITYYLTNKLY